MVALSGAMMPGPLFTVTVSEAATRGSRAGLLLIVGHSILELVLVVGFVLGISRFLANPVLVRTIGVLGGAFLLWMGAGILRGALGGKLSLELSAASEPPRFGPIMAGIAISLSNPYWTVWWATIGANWIVQALKHQVAGISVFYLGHILGDFVWYGVVALAVTTGARFLTDRGYRVVLGACGVFLVLLGLVFLLNIPLF